MGALEEHGNSVFLIFEDAGRDVVATLSEFGQAYLAFVTKPEVLSLTKMAMSDGVSSDLAPEIYRRGQQRGLSAMQTYLQGLIDAGILKASSAEIASLHLKAVLEAGLREPLLHGIEPNFSIDEAVEAAIPAFLKAYGYSSDSF